MASEMGRGFNHPGEGSRTAYLLDGAARRNRDSTKVNVKS